MKSEHHLVGHIRTPHRVSKLYYRVATPEKLADYQAVFGNLVMRIDGCERRAVGWQPWAITTFNPIGWAKPLPFIGPIICSLEEPLIVS